MEEDTLILVDAKDNKIGEEKKQLTHERGLLHRAFSIFLFYRDENGLWLLLQQRNKNKYHCGGLWTNTCCSHPRPGETTIEAANRRLIDELNISADLKHVGSFIYRADFPNGLIEHEYDHVFVGWFEKVIPNYNTSEIQAAEWVKVSELLADLKANPEKYTPWFHKALDIALFDVNGSYD